MFKIILCKQVYRILRTCNHICSSKKFKLHPCSNCLIGQKQGLHFFILCKSNDFKRYTLINHFKNIIFAFSKEIQI